MIFRVTLPHFPIPLVLAISFAKIVNLPKKRYSLHEMNRSLLKPNTFWELIQTFLQNKVKLNKKQLHLLEQNTINRKQTIFSVTK